MGWAVTHWRQPRHFLLLLWFWSVVVTGGMLTESPPSSQRLVIAIPAVALIVAFGLEQSVRLACRLLALDRKWENAVLGLLVLLLALSLRRNQEKPQTGKEEAAQLPKAGIRTGTQSHRRREGKERRKHHLDLAPPAW